MKAKKRSKKFAEKFRAGLSARGEVAQEGKPLLPDKTHVEVKEERADGGTKTVIKRKRFLMA